MNIIENDYFTAEMGGVIASKLKLAKGT